MIDLFWDEKLQGFYDTGHDQPALIIRPRDLFDNATPSGTSVAADVLQRLAALAENPAYQRLATTSLRSLAPFIDKAATAFGWLLGALDFYLSPRQELVLIWPQGSSREGAGPLLDVVRRGYHPNLLLIGAAEGQGRDLSPLLQNRPAIGGRATAYLCEGYVCQAPTGDPEELRRQAEAAI
jgi:uncharacterized protein YyaL (SSP411 family)